jgi:tetratricopeptide (TPR) repeat protein
MGIGASIHLSKESEPGLRGVSVLVLLLVLCGGYATPQQPPTTSKAHKSSSVATQSAFQEAESLLAQGLLDQAKEKIEEQLKLNPSSVEGLNLLGIVCTNQKDYGTGLDAFQRALKLNPNSTKTHNNLANLYVIQEKPDLAEKELRRVLLLDPANRDGNYNLGLLLMAKGSATEAIPHFQRVRPPNIETQFNLTRAYLRAGRTAEGLKTATELSSQHKNDVRLHFTLGVCWPREAISACGTRTGKSERALQPETLEILYNLAQSYLRKERTRRRASLNRALKLKPDSPDILYLMAQVASEQSRPVDALDLLARAHKLAPENADIVFLLSRVSMSQNYFEDAIPLLESGVKIAPRRADLRAALGESYFMAGRAEKAIDEFKKLIELDPSARSYAFMGLSYRHLGRFEEARKYFEAGLKHDRRDASCLFNIGYIEERQGNYAAAEKLFQENARNPNLSEALLELANLESQKQFAEAAVLLRRYVKVSHEPPAGYYKLAMGGEKSSRRRAAQRDLNVFQTLSKNASPGPYPYQHLFDYLSNRSDLPAQAKTQMDLTELNEQLQKHPDQPQDLYLLAETYLKLGKPDEARKAVAQLDELSSGDYRTQTGIGVLLARYRLYDDAIHHFLTALHANPDSDDVKFDLADAYFRGSLPGGTEHDPTSNSTGPAGRCALSIARRHPCAWVRLRGLQRSSGPGGRNGQRPVLPFADTGAASRE